MNGLAYARVQNYPFIHPCSHPKYPSSHLSSKPTICLPLMPTLRVELDTVTEWLRANKLTADVETNKYIVFGSSHNLRNTSDYKLKINGNRIDKVTSMKYLSISDTTSVANKHKFLTVQNCTLRTIIKCDK